MRLDGAWRDVCIRDISSRGMLLQGPHAPSRGTYIEVARGRHIVVARVVWAQEQRFGAQTQDRIDIEAIVREPDSSAIDFKAASKADPTFERRSPARVSETARLADRLELSRRRSGTFQFVVVIAVGAFAATAAAQIVSDTLSRPFEVIAASTAR